MPKFFCDYCDVYLTHDSMSVRKSHNAGRNHLRNVTDYYQQIGHEKAQSVIDSITNSYADAGLQQPNPMLQHASAPGGFPPMGFPGPGESRIEVFAVYRADTYRYATTSLWRTSWANGHDASRWSRYAISSFWSEWWTTEYASWYAWISSSRLATKLQSAIRSKRIQPESAVRSKWSAWWRTAWVKSESCTRVWWASWIRTTSRYGKTLGTSLHARRSRWTINISNPTSSSECKQFIWLEETAFTNDEGQSRHETTPSGTVKADRMSALAPVACGSGLQRAPCETLPFEGSDFAKCGKRSTCLRTKSNWKGRRDTSP